MDANGKRQISALDGSGDAEPADPEATRVLVIDHRQLMRDSLAQCLMERASSLLVTTAEAFSGDPPAKDRPRIILLNLGGSDLADPVIAARKRKSLPTHSPPCRATDCAVTFRPHSISTCSWRLSGSCWLAGSSSPLPWWNIARENSIR
jgi:hypothetical protein